MIIRRYKNSDLNSVARLFYDTVHMVNAEDYTRKQLNVWSKNADSLKARKNDLLNQNTLVAELDGHIVGFGSIDDSGYLDLLYVHKGYQRMGIATALCDKLEKGFPAVTTYASITAKDFFEKRGYRIIKSQEVERSGVKLKNFKMLKI